MKKYGLILCHDIKKTDSGYELNEQTRERTDAGIKLLEEVKVEKLIMSGGCEHLYPIYISTVMKEYAIKMGIGPELIIEENLSRDTAGQLLFSKIGIIKPLGVKEIIIITSGYHVPRVKEEANFVFGQGYKLSFLGVPCDDSEKRSEEQEKASLRSFKKDFLNVSPGDDEKILKNLFTFHKFYIPEANNFSIRLEELKRKYL